MTKQKKPFGNNQFATFKVLVRITLLDNDTELQQCLKAVANNLRIYITLGSGQCDTMRVQCLEVSDKPPEGGTNDARKDT